MWPGHFQLGDTTAHLPTLFISVQAYEFWSTSSSMLVLSLVLHLCIPRSRLPTTYILHQDAKNSGSNSLSELHRKQVRHDSPPAHNSVLASTVLLCSTQNCHFLSFFQKHLYSITADHRQTFCFSDIKHFFHACIISVSNYKR